MADPMDTSNSEGRIALKVQSQSGNEVHFSVKPTIRFKKIMTAYCAAQGKEMKETRFLYQGMRLQEEETPGELTMEDGDIIEAVTEQIGGQPPVVSNTKTFITIKVRCDEGEVSFKIPPTTPMKRLMEKFCERRGVQLEKTNFLYDGQRLTGNETAEQLDMEEEDSIDAVEIHELGPRITLQFNSPNGNVRIMRIRTKAPLGTVMAEYWEREGIFSTQIRFLYQGVRLQLDQTPEQLEMEDGDSVDVAYEQLGGGPNDLPDKLITIKVRYYDDVQMAFKIKPTYPMKKLMEKFCERRGTQFENTKFLYDGQRLTGDETAEGLAMEDEDSIDAVDMQESGSRTTRSPQMQEPGSRTTLRQLMNGTSSRTTRPQQMNGTGSRMTLQFDAHNGNVRMMKIRSKSPLGKIMEEYREQQGVSKDMIRFLYQGTRLMGTETPDEMEMEDGDSVDVTYQQLGGGPEDQFLNIKVKSRNTETFFKIKPKTVMKRVMDKYCERQDVKREDVRFLFDGMRVDETQTAEELGMEDGDHVDVMDEQLGG
ncbi:hypothetical protein HDV00_009224 [Rhizophlyctis rosea]|nr:hypothetical protein HDV00_009224 [Rhizophlyctis rosea]